MIKDSQITFTLVGDLMLGGYFSEHFSDLKSRYIPAEIRSWFDSDVIFANLECVSSNIGKPLKNKIVTYCFPETLQVLNDLNVSVVSLANNHQIDYGIEASEVTRRLLDKRGIFYGGVGRNLAEARQPVVIKQKEQIIVFLFFIDYSDSLPVKHAILITVIKN